MSSKVCDLQATLQKELKSSDPHWDGQLTLTDVFSLMTSGSVNINMPAKGEFFVLEHAAE